MMDMVYNTVEAAKYLGVSSRTLERWRQNGTGPYFIRPGYRVVYRLIDLKQWQHENRSL